MKQAKITCTFTSTIDLDPNNYDQNPTGSEISTAEMLEIEKEAFEDDPELILNLEQDSYIVTAVEVKENAER